MTTKGGSRITRKTGTREYTAIHEDLLKAKEDLKFMALNEEEHKSEFETLEKRIQVFQSQNKSLRAQIPHKVPELLTRECLPRQHGEDLILKLCIPCSVLEYK
ncbi:hypothetical protein L798_02653 [Zootermopsis nevadensis]|uniref:Uncharacterized protein n=1 Tax=Zootermopsis nevadensis TaxID=136037 RepID=A0A067QH76_ZOONE|nr:hypothetical protein L798_02653 [Zootermopsis nevadensis]